MKLEDGEEGLRGEGGHDDVGEEGREALEKEVVYIGWRGGDL